MNETNELATAHAAYTAAVAEYTAAVAAAVATERAAYAAWKRARVAKAALAALESTNMEGKNGNE